MDIGELDVISGIFGTSARFVCAPFPFGKTVSVGILVAAGSFTERGSCIGYSHFLEHMLFKGTERLDFEALNREFEKLGAYVNAFTGKYYTLFYVHTLEEFAGTCLSLLLEMVLDSTLPAEEIEKEKKVVLEEISSYKDNPEDYLTEEFYSKTFQGSFFGHPILGDGNTIREITREKLLAYYKKQYVLDNIIISVAGRFEKNQLLKQLESVFTRFSSSSSPSSHSKTPVPFYIHPHTHYKSDLEQAYVCLGFHTYPLKISKQVLKLFNTILGGMSSSRLYMGIREKRALCYGIDSSLYMDPNTGFLNIFASTQTHQLSGLLDAIGEEIQGFARNPVSEEELNIAKNQLKSRMVFRQENVSQTMLRLASQVFFYGKNTVDEKILQRLEQIKIEDFEPLYNRLSPQEMSIHTLISKNYSSYNKRSSYAIF